MSILLLSEKVLKVLKMRAKSKHSDTFETGTTGSFQILVDRLGGSSPPSGTPITGPRAWALGQLGSSSPFGRFSSPAQWVGASRPEPPPDVENLTPCKM